MFLWHAPQDVLTRSFVYFAKVKAVLERGSSKLEENVADAVQSNVQHKLNLCNICLTVVPAVLLVDAVIELSGCSHLEEPQIVKRLNLRSFLCITVVQINHYLSKHTPLSTTGML